MLMEKKEIKELKQEVNSLMIKLKEKIDKDFKELEWLGEKIYKVSKDEWFLMGFHHQKAGTIAELKRFIKHSNNYLDDAIKVIENN